MNNGENITLKNLLKQNFNAELPISGGMGSSIADAIVIELDNTPFGIRLEYLVAKNIMILGNIKAEFARQELMHRDEKKYDKLIFNIQGEEEKNLELYFDITNFYGKF